MKDTIKKRLNKLEKELLTPHAESLVAARKEGVINWMGVDYKTDTEHNEVIKHYRITAEKPLVILEQIKLSEDKH